MHLFSFIKELFSGQGASALCWTLIHSLWQGLFFVIATGIILVATKRSKPALRYKILSIQFLIFTIVPVITFIIEWNSTDRGNYFQPVEAGYALTSTSSEAATVSSPIKYELLQTISVFLSRYASVIVMTWFIVLMVKSIKITSSLIYTYRLRTHKAFKAPVYWNDKIITLCRQLHITKTVQLLESAVIKVPAVFGHIKPVIFFPLGILANLSPQQVEAVLLHELAHIRRNDYLFNLIQNIIETLFFFNPALLWISSIIREERENCCDDIAIAQTKNKRQFIESLIRFRELNIQNNTTVVTAFPGTKNSFLNRVTRIAMNKNKTLQPAENIFVAVSLIIISTLVMAFCQIKEPPVPPKPAAAPAMQMSVVAPPAPVLPGNIIPAPVPPVPVTDTIPKLQKQSQRSTSNYQNRDDEYSISSYIDKGAKKEMITLRTDGNEYKLVKLNGEIAYLVVNDEKVPTEKMGDYSEIIKKINADLERMREEQRIRDKEQEQRNAEQLIRNKEQEQRNAEQVERNKEQEIRNAEQAERNEEQTKRNAQQAQQNEEQKRRDAEQVIRNKEQEQRNAEQLIRNKEQEQRNAEQVIRNKEQEVRNAEMKKLISELIDDNIIKDRKDLHSFSLSEDELIVNGIKQSPEVFKKYKTKYPKLVGNSYNYRYE